MCRPIIDSQSIMVVEFVGAECVVGFVEVEFVVVHVPRIAHVLATSVSLVETRSSQFYLLLSIFGPHARGVAYKR